MLNINAVSLEEVSRRPYIETSLENVFCCPETQTVLFLGAEEAIEVSMKGADSKNNSYAMAKYDLCVVMECLAEVKNALMEIKAFKDVESATIELKGVLKIKRTIKENLGLIRSCMKDLSDNDFVYDSAIEGLIGEADYTLRGVKNVFKDTEEALRIVDDATEGIDAALFVIIDEYSSGSEAVITDGFGAGKVESAIEMPRHNASSKSTKHHNTEADKFEAELIKAIMGDLKG